MAELRFFVAEFVERLPAEAKHDIHLRDPLCGALLLHA